MKALLCLIFISIAPHAFTQPDSTAPEKQKFVLGITYQSVLHYMGRTDSNISSGFMPTAEIWLSRSAYLAATPMFTLQGSNISYAGTVLKAGLQHITHNWLSQVYASVPIYRSDVPLVQSAIRAQAGLSITNINKVLNLTAGGEVRLSDKVGYGISAGIDHLVRIQGKRNMLLLINPSLSGFAGTAEVAESDQARKSIPFLPVNDSQTPEKSDGIGILAYEFGIPVVVVLGKWEVQAVPTMTKPVYQGHEGDVTSADKFLISLSFGLKYRF